MEFYNENNDEVKKYDNDIVTNMTAQYLGPSDW